MKPFHVLIVDDEIHSIRGVQAGVNWEKHNITTVFTALNVKKAQDTFLNNTFSIPLPGDVQYLGLKNTRRFTNCPWRKSSTLIFSNRTFRTRLLSPALILIHPW